ncbi:bifunctional 3'-5' exonuclease/DNA polymerase [uncultured Caudovirales phage]|uniref:Bifunctional 3'-5' exonuclease/DNA polymerase n=1 Tax=uncultured Caudovirales phage TaxID=2100421 RepID=A0A6J7WFK3_9CAUD|nr:bifunctional 3'-5' exonuclease/DNA polymerase [uncultured Caudovirales phage]
MLWLDFETRSRCDLKAAGVYNYAQDASTEVLCMSYAFDDEDVQTWTPDQPFPAEVLNYKGVIYAHNAAFERLIFWYVLQVNFDLEQFYCTAAQARANCAPGSLEDVGRFAGASMKKDHRGAQLIRLLSIPQADGTFRQDPTLMAEMIAYCETDVKAMRAVSKALRPLSADELADYHVNERINDRGVLVDVPLCDAAVKFASDELIEIEQIVAEVTEGAITSVRSPKMRQWVIDRVGPQALKLMESYKDGEKKYSIDKTVRANLLAMENPDEIPPAVAEVIQCADDLWASSVAKFSRLASLADVEDQRVRGAFVFAGGSATGRASSYGAQVHNFTRKCAESPEDVRTAMVRGHAIVPRFGKRVTDVLKGMLRPALIPAKGKHLVVADWAAIEARANPWLSNCSAGERKLEIFAKGDDVYKVNAGATFGVAPEDVTKDQRQIGKVQELACGFAGGVGAFAAMGRAYGVHLPESDAKRMVDAWRRANPWSVPYWQNLEEAYTRAMRNKGHGFSVGRVTYMFDGQHLWYALPSGRVLCYPFAKLEPDGVTYAKAAWKPAADAKEWPRARLWKGLACENITQATANDLLRHSLRQLDDVVLHVHDEIVLETDRPEEMAARLEKVMCTPPAWAEGLPLDAEVAIMSRYGK